MKYNTPYINLQTNKLIFPGNIYTNIIEFEKDEVITFNLFINIKIKCLYIHHSKYLFILTPNTDFQVIRLLESNVTIVNTINCNTVDDTRIIQFIDGEQPYTINQNVFKNATFKDATNNDYMQAAQIIKCSKCIESDVDTYKLELEIGDSYSSSTHCNINKKLLTSILDSINKDFKIKFIDL